MSNNEADLREQWGNPRDILSLLLLLGGDIVQKAIAQLVGYQVRPIGQRGPAVSVAPVAFSFGWVAYSFTSLLAAFGDRALMPPCDHPCILVNSYTGFARENRSWALGRLLRDHEIRNRVDPRSEDEGGRAESLRVDIFELLPVGAPALDLVWWLGWITLLIQIAIAIVPWAVYGDWIIALVTFCGSLLASVTCAMPQWILEKWTCRQVKRDKITCLTKGNGSHHIMVFIAGSGAWDFENLAAGLSSPQPGTRGMSLGLMVLWTCLLITVSGISHHTWYLVCIGGIGMLQNLFAAGFPRGPEASNFHLQKSSRTPTIIGLRGSYEDEPDADVDLKETEDELAELALWAYESSQGLMPIQAGRETPQRHTMPKWLESMQGEEVPEWLRAKDSQIATAKRSKLRSLISELLSPTDKESHENNSAEARVVRIRGGVHGALIELEKRVPTAGLAMLDVFFPQGLGYSDKTVRDNVHKRFWRQAYHTKDVRQKAEVKRRQQYPGVAIIS